VRQLSGRLALEPHWAHVDGQQNPPSATPPAQVGLGLTHGAGLSTHDPASPLMVAEPHCDGRLLVLPQPGPGPRRARVWRAFVPLGHDSDAPSSLAAFRGDFSTGRPHTLLKDEANAGESRLVLARQVAAGRAV